VTNQNRKERVLQAQRTAILAAAAAIFGSKGFDGATIADVARQAGVAVGTIYKFFPGKQALHAALLEDRASAILAAEVATAGAPAARGVTKITGAEALQAGDTFAAWLDDDSERRTRNLHAMRAEILAAAATLFETRGFQGTTMADIAQATGMATGTLYTVFPNKEVLFQRLIEEKVDAYLTYVRSAVDPLAGAVAKLTRLVAAECAFCEADRAFLRLYIAVNNSFEVAAQQALSAAIRPRHTQYLTWVTAILASGMAEGTLRPGDPGEMAQALVVMLNALIFDWVANNPAGTLAARVQPITDLLLYGTRAVNSHTVNSHTVNPHA
jgi:AcrR family transcriptional regulator